MEKVATYADIDANFLLYSKKYNVKFKPTGGLIKLKEGSNEIDYVFEVVRRNEDWQNAFATKVQLYSDFFENFVKNDAGLSGLPQLVFVGEDVQHLAEMFRVIKQITAVLKDNEIYFTTDLKQLEDSLENSISIFEQDNLTKKYKLVNLSLDILKPGDNLNEASKTIKVDTKFNPNMIVE